MNRSEGNRIDVALTENSATEVLQPPVSSQTVSTEDIIASKRGTDPVCTRTSMPLGNAIPSLINSNPSLPSAAVTGNTIASARKPRLKLSQQYGFL